MEKKHLKDNNILNEFQSGFRTSYPMDTCLINLQDGIRMEISQGKYVGMVLIGLQNTFDTVDHDILLEKNLIIWSLITINCLNHI